ncbi:MAG: GMP synthase, partial [uncultured bacterium]
MESTHDYIAVIDFGSQFAHLIARRVRQHGVLAKIFTPDTPTHHYADAKGVILSGGPKSTIAIDAVPYDPGIFKLSVPILGLCYGHQLIAMHFGGKVAKGKTKEYGQADVTVTDHTDLFRGLGKTERVWMSHWDVVTQVPAGFEVIGSTPDCDIAIMRHRTKQIWS